MKYDLHSHTTASDGTLSPNELLRHAAAIGIDCLAITDHDTLAGALSARKQASVLGVRLVLGVEVSTHHFLTAGYGKKGARRQGVHIVALASSGKDDKKDKAAVFARKMDDYLVAVQQSRALRGRQIADKLADLLGVASDRIWQAALTFADNPQSVGRPHLAQSLVALGFARSVPAAFDIYLADNKAAFVPIASPTMADAVTAIHAAGGVSVLAHPMSYRLSATGVRALIADFAAAGGVACELPNVADVNQRAMIDRVIAQHDLLVSVGSDFHGSIMPWRKLGNTAALNKDQVGVWVRL